MKKIVSLVVAIAMVSIVSAQTTNPVSANIVDRAGDHLMFQLSSDHWANMPDSIAGGQKGFSRGVGIYFMINKPFKTDPRYSIAFGIGVGNSNIFFQEERVLVAATSPTLQFPSDSLGNHFKKYKLATSYVEAPIELRYVAHPEKENKSFKAALGVKIGLLLDAHTKAKELEDKNDNLLNDYTEKESKGLYFSTARLSGTARVGYGNFSLFGTYQITSLLKSGAGPNIQFFQIGLCLSGL